MNTDPHRADQTNDLTGFACPNEDCSDFNRFAAGNLSVCEWTGKNKNIRRLYCSSCGQRFSERRGTLLQYSKQPQETVTRIIKCLVHGCSVEAAADICEVDPRTVELLQQKAGQRAEDFHRLQMQQLDQPLEAVEMDEMHARTTEPKKGATQLLAVLAKRVRNVVAQGRSGCISPW